MHKKESVISPVLEAHLGVTTVVMENFNTDKFGTFSGEICRNGSQLEAARQKAYAAMFTTRSDLAISSEGSFGSHPYVPFVQSNHELVLLVDKKNGLEILGQCRTSETNINGRYVRSVEETLAFAREVGFPGHGVIVRKNQNGKYGIHKNIDTEEHLISIVKKLLGGLFTKRVYLETDMRAHKNPTRMKAIEQAMLDLIKNIQSICPKCETPGFVVTKIDSGLKCSSCLQPTNLPIKEIFICKKCTYTYAEPIKKYGELADPMYCGNCNP